MTTVVLLVNPVSGRGTGALTAVAAERRLLARGVEVRVRTGESPDHMRRLAAAAVRERPDALAVVGGDGTLALILDEVLDANIPLALVPAGTGDDLARALSLPTGSPAAAAAAVDLILAGNTRAIDVGVAECAGRRVHFLTVCAIGLDARVADRTNRLRWPKGRLRYSLALVIELMRLSPLPFQISIDGGEVESRPGILLAIGNTRSYGGGIPMCPDADPSDGSFDVAHVAPIGRTRLIRLFPLLLRGRHTNRSEVTLVRAREIEVAAPGLVAYTDGERLGEDAVRIRMAGAQLRVFAA